MARTKRGIDAFGGNMPFLGGRRIATEHGDRYAEWLTEMYAGSGGTDYVGYFFHRAERFMAPSGSLGFIATSAIADSENRRTVLGRLVDQGFHIHAANTDMPWPGNAQVLVSTLFLERGLPEEVTRPRRLDGRTVQAINSRLRVGEEWPEPDPLPENAGLALVGCFLRGTGFILEPSEAEALLERHPNEAQVVRPFLTGDDLSNSVGQRAQRYVIDFRDMTLDEARAYPQALATVEERVRPGRQRLKTTGADAEHRKYWWRFANVRKELRERAAEVPRLLATARVSKHSSFAFVPSDWTPSEQVVVFPLPTWTAFAVLQSRVHTAWVEVQATRMGDAPRYSAGECFAPFPFPQGDPQLSVPRLEKLGERLYAARAKFMSARQIGLTATYNALSDPEVRDSGGDELRTLHEQLDQAVLDAYGWKNIEVPPFGLQSRPFEDSVADRLFGLNARRHAERTEGLAPGPTVKKARKATGPGPKRAVRGAAKAAKQKRGTG